MAKKLKKTLRKTTPTRTAKPQRRARKITSKRQGYAAPFMATVTKNGNSKQLVDPFESNYGLTRGHKKILTPMYTPQTLVKVALGSSVLKQCIEAYRVNIESYGHTLEYIGEDGQEDRPEVKKEKRNLESFLRFPSNDTSTLQEIREKSRVDKEITGARYFEISRNQRGEIVLFTDAASATMRMTVKDAEPTDFTIKVPDTDGDGWMDKDVCKSFRRFVQIGKSNKKVFFKEFGDPRPIDPKDGRVNDSLDIEDQATEIYMDAIYMPASPYGVPRWIGALAAILGARESELVNLNFFRENAIPAMAVLISGGMLTEDSFDKISDYITASKGQDSMNRVIVLEASSDDTQGTIDQHPPAPQIKMEPMSDKRQSEGMFGVYEESGTKKVRSTMRLPPIHIGLAEEYTKATAAASQRVAELQVFHPERTSFDNFINNKVISTYEPQYYRFKTLGPQINDPDSLSRMLDTFHRTGGLTPNIVIKLANAMLDVHIEKVKDEWGDLPIQFTSQALMNGADVKGLEDFTNPLKDLEDDDSEDDDNPVNDNVAAMVRRVIRKELHTIATELDDLRSQTFANSDG